MQSAPNWDTRYQELHTALRFAETVLGDRHAPAAVRERATQLFIRLWPEFCRHIQRMAPTTLPDRAASR